ncbi:hypothetical protein BP6252_03366 [Coleophoma cylindrospora]|uniref:Genetic interactor of prohibitins 3, mitochondrial n=1 Tax=Coleophoma cylindrospora TaxID=1849047 RepID=A0A3D8S851_9HELO|nr:hypothetical protein BP6252_03366 [Coleophoma cylindrospora]
MSIRAGGIRLSRHGLRSLELPEFLCPALRHVNILYLEQSRERNSTAPCIQRRHASSAIPRTDSSKIALPEAKSLRKLPQQCAGCGALSQTVDSEEPGYYSLGRRSVKDFLVDKSAQKSKEESAVVEAAFQNINSEVLGSLGLQQLKPAGEYGLPFCGKVVDFPPSAIKPVEVPICDRCHRLKHHDTGVSIHHPSVQSLQDTILESPHKYNHIYHVIDAADFPMSLVPGLHRLLHLTPQRSLNRRSKGGRFYHGRKTEVSFIITRSDLLAPLKSQVDTMMPYLIEVLRDALGKSGRDVRLGNVRCVSAIRGWWTKELKEDIWSRGGGGWLVGKVNVGKSQLFHDVFPKGRRGTAKSPEIIPASSRASMEDLTAEIEDMKIEDEPLFDEEHIDTSTLLPPQQPETDYPTMPLVSSLPGTTASPIRVPFGNGKGELIDLPGLSRGDLELYVKEEHRPSLVMRSRVRPEQQVIKPGQSLLLGGLIRITPTTPDLIFLGYVFTPIQPHLTATEKAIGTQTQVRESGIENIGLPGVGEKIASAGTFYLKWDVTKQRTGPITARDAAAIKVDRLPYRVLSTDILIEGCGWVELVAQVRKRPSEMSISRNSNSDIKVEEADEMDGIDPQWPAVEVFTPEGKFVGSRRPMNAWLLSAKKPGQVRVKGRPRQSMKGVKKAGKKSARTSESV